MSYADMSADMSYTKYILRAGESTPSTPALLEPHAGTHDWSGIASKTVCTASRVVQNAAGLHEDPLGGGS